MATEAETARHYQDARTAQLSERVANIGSRQSELEAEMRSGFRQIEQSFTSFTAETRASINALAANLADRNKPQWQAIGVALTFVVIMGGLVYWPIREQTGDVKSALALVAEKMVTREELDWRSERGQEDRARTDTAISDLRGTMVTRAEWQERNASRDNENANTQRQIDQLRGDFVSFASSLGNGRDSFADMKAEIRRLEERLDAWRMRRTQPAPTP